jgi:hypothetical protein
VKKLTVISMTMLLASVILFSCKKSSTNNNSASNLDSIEIKNIITGTVSFKFDTTSINENIYQCAMLQHKDYFLLAGNTNTTTDSLAYPQYTFTGSIKLPSGTVTLGTYSSTLDSFNNIEYTYLINMINNPNHDYTAYNSSFFLPSAHINFTIDSFNTTTNRIHCVFSGTMKNQFTGDTVTHIVTNGVVTGTVQFSNQ